MSISLVDIALLALGVFLLKKVLTPKRALPYPPGPPGLPIIGNVLDLPQSEQYKTFAEWGRKYGGMVYVNAMGQPLIILNDVKTANALLDKKGSLYSDRPTMEMAGELTGWRDTLVLQRSHGSRLKEMRKSLHRLIGTAAAAEKYHSLFEAETKNFLKRMLKAPEEVQASIRKTAGAIIMMMSYGYKVLEDNDPILHIVDVATDQFSRLTEPGAYLVDFFPLLKYVPEWVPGATFKHTAKEYGKTLQEMADMPFDIVKKELAEGTALPSFITDNLEGKQVSAEDERNLKWAAASLYSGGADTTVSTIYTFYLTMTLFPEAQTKAQAEIDRVVGTDRLPTMADRPNLPYVEALVSEVFRWGPVGPTGIPHRLLEDDIHDGYFIPKGSIIIVNAWHMLHDPERYADPLAFNPDRFIATEGKPAEQDPRVCNFGFGRRFCPGYELANATVWLSIAMGLATFNITKARDAAGNEITPSGKYLDGTIAHPEPFQCDIKPRSAQAEALILAE